MRKLFAYILIACLLKWQDFYLLSQTASGVIILSVMSFLSPISDFYFLGNSYELSKSSVFRELDREGKAHRDYTQRLTHCEYCELYSQITMSVKFFSAD